MSRDRRRETRKTARPARRRPPAPGDAGAPPSRGSVWGDDRARFVVAFALVAGCLLGFYYFPRGPDDLVERWTSSYLRAYTNMVSVVVGLFDRGASAHGNTITGRFSMQIVKSCDAMEANILFVSALLAVAAPWVRKAAALAVGLFALVTFNLVRLFVLYWTGVFAMPVFEFFHYDVWPLLVIAFATLDFVVCVRWARREGTWAGVGSGTAASHAPG